MAGDNVRSQEFRDFTEERGNMHPDKISVDPFSV